MEKIVYAFDPQTRRYAGPVTLDDSDRCQIAGDWHVPGNCLEVEPPVVTDAEFVVENAGKWETRQYRGSNVLADEAPVEFVPNELKLFDKVALLNTQVQSELDSQARAYRFTDIAEAISFAADESVPLFWAQGRAFRTLRGLTWGIVEPWLDAVLAGTKTLPAWDELRDALPILDTLKVAEDKAMLEQKQAAAAAEAAEPEAATTVVDAPAPAAPAVKTKSTGRRARKA